MGTLSERLMKKISVKEGVDVDMLTSKISKCFKRAVDPSKAAKILAKWYGEETHTSTEDIRAMSVDDFRDDVFYMVDAADPDAETNALYKALGEEK